MLQSGLWLLSCNTSCAPRQVSVVIGLYELARHRGSSRPVSKCLVCTACDYQRLHVCDMACRPCPTKSESYRETHAHVGCKSDCHPIHNSQHSLATSENMHLECDSSDAAADSNDVSFAYRNKMNEVSDGAVGYPGLRDKFFPKVACKPQPFSPMECPVSRLSNAFALLTASDPMSLSVSFCGITSL